MWLSSATNLLKMMYGQPDLPLSIEHAAQVTPGHGKVWLGFNCLQVTCLQQVNSKKQEEEEVERRVDRGGVVKVKKPKDQIKRKKKTKRQTEKVLVSILTKCKKWAYSMGTRARNSAALSFTLFLRCANPTNTYTPTYILQLRGFKKR